MAVTRRDHGRRWCHRGWHLEIDRRGAIAGLPGTVQSPAVLGPGAVHRAGVILARGDLGQGPAGHDPGGVHGDRHAAAGRRAAAELAVVVTAPAVGGARGGQHAAVLIARADLGEDQPGQHSGGGHGHRHTGTAGPAVAQLPIRAVAPAIGRAGHAQRTRVVVADADLAEPDTAGRHRHRLAGAAGSAVAELAGTAQAPAVRGPGAGQRARSQATRAHLDERRPGQHAAGGHAHRLAGAAGPAVAELAGGALAPAVGRPGAGHSARRVFTGADLGERRPGQHPGGGNRHRHAAVGGRAVAQLAVRVVAPAVGAPGAGQRAGVTVARGDLGQGHPGQHPAGVHRHRRCAADRRVVAQLAVSVVAPAVRLARDDHARVVISGRDRGRVRFRCGRG